MSEISDQLPWFLPLCVAMISLCVGSFLNVVIYRLPLMLESTWRQDCCSLLELEPEKEAKPLTLSTPNSHCPSCEAPIKPWHNIPLLSYIALGGKCSNCGAGISLRYPLVELVTALLSLCLLLHFDFGPQLFGALIFTWALVALTMIDLDHQLLPDNITLPLLWLGLILNVSGTYVEISDAVIGAAAGYGILWSIYWLFKLVTGKEGMGYGDFKLLAALGAWMGWQSLHLIILMSSVVGAVLGIALMVINRRGKEIPIAFGPYLAVAGWITFLWGTELMQAVPFLNLWMQ
jgi:leader peptidase (prepilin peptidase) / N-methyltransferase